jgi:hypothetical protein
LAPFGDAEQLRMLIDTDAAHRSLYKVFLEVRDAAAGILEHTSLADLVSGTRTAAPKAPKRPKTKKQRETGSVLPMVIHGTGSKT